MGEIHRLSTFFRFFRLIKYFYSQKYAFRDYKMQVKKIQLEAERDNRKPLNSNFLHSRKVQVAIKINIQLLKFNILGAMQRLSLTVIFQVDFDLKSAEIWRFVSFLKLMFFPKNKGSHCSCFSTKIILTYFFHRPLQIKILKK